MKHNLNICCPACHGHLDARILVCNSCGIRVEGTFARSEFDQLDENEMHFLRIFVHSEGKIREVEKALGVSYPTVKARLANLKEKLGLDSTSSDNKAGASPDSIAPSAADVIAALDRGDITPEDAIRKLNS